MKIPEDMTDGTIHRMLLNGDLTIVQYHNTNTVEVRFISYKGTIIASSNLIRKKMVKNPMLPIIYGVGCVGIGKYSNKYHKKAYTAWNNMLKRCYCITTQEKHPTYKDCSVADKWLNFQNFAKWFYKNCVDDYELDKDLKVQGNKIYGENTCLFIPKNVNRIITDSLASRSKYGIGVTYHKRYNKLVVGCNDGTKKRTHLGYFDVEKVEEARKVYFDYKYKIIKELATRQADSAIRHALLSWVIPEN
jgi:hypothetical protein